MISMINSVDRTRLLSIIYQSVGDNKLPGDWKTAMVTMIPKKSNRLTDPTNYRPIIITSSFGKIAERLVLPRLEKHHRKMKIIKSSSLDFKSITKCVTTS